MLGIWMGLVLKWTVWITETSSKVLFAWAILMQIATLWHYTAVIINMLSISQLKVACLSVLSTCQWRAGEHNWLNHLIPRGSSLGQAAVNYPIWLRNKNGKNYPIWLRNKSGILMVLFKMQSRVAFWCASRLIHKSKGNCHLMINASVFGQERDAINLY